MTSKYKMDKAKVVDIKKKEQMVAEKLKAREEAKKKQEAMAANWFMESAKYTWPIQASVIHEDPCTGGIQWMSDLSAQQQSYNNDLIASQLQYAQKQEPWAELSAELITTKTYLSLAERKAEYFSKKYTYMSIIAGISIIGWITYAMLLISK